METALQVIYAKINNRIPGREYPCVSPTQMRQDRGTHCLKALYTQILQFVEARSELAGQLEQEFETVFQTAYHKGVQDLIVDGELVHRFFLAKHAPSGKPQSGDTGTGPTSPWTTLTLLNSLSRTRKASQNSPGYHAATYRIAYYGQRNMRWAHYSARDHERGRTYVVIGTRFFARLVQGLVAIAAEQWMWVEQFARRWHERSQVIVMYLVRSHFQQSFE